MSGPRVCLCQGKPLNELLVAFISRAKKDVAAGVLGGKPASFKELQLTAYLVRSLSEGRRSAFDAKYRNYDHHLPECPCSPRYQAKTAL